MKKRIMILFALVVLAANFSSCVVRVHDDHGHRHHWHHHHDDEVIIK